MLFFHTHVSLFLVFQLQENCNDELENFPTIKHTFVYMCVCVLTRREKQSKEKQVLMFITLVTNITQLHQIIQIAFVKIVPGASRYRIGFVPERFSIKIIISKPIYN